MRPVLLRLALVWSLAVTSCAESPIGDAEQDGAPPGPGTADSAVDITLDGSETQPDAAVDVQIDSAAAMADSAASSDGQVQLPDATQTSDARVQTPEADASLDATAPVPMPDAGGVRDAARPMVDATVDATVRDAAPPPMEAAAPMCTAPQRACGATCVDTRSDTMNCGGCGMRCGQGESCLESRCFPRPPEGCTPRAFANHAYLFCGELRTWRDARSACLAARMDLVVIDDNAENEFVRTLGNPAWIGASDIATEGRFLTPVRGNAERVDGPQVPFTKWANEEPNNARHCQDGREFGDLCIGGEWVDEDCGQLYEDGTWNDARCVQTLRAVCEAY